MPKKFSFLFSLQSFPSTLFYLQTNTLSEKGIGPRVVHRLALMDGREWWVLIICVCHVDGLDYYYKKYFFFVLVVYKLIHKDVHRLFIKDKKGNGRLIEESEHTLQAIVWEHTFASSCSWLLFLSFCVNESPKNDEKFFFLRDVWSVFFYVFLC